MAAPIRLVERKVVSPRPAPSPNQRAGLLGSLWLGSDDQTVIVPLETFVREVARQIAEAQELAVLTAAPGEPTVLLRPVPRAEVRPVPGAAAP